VKSASFAILLPALALLAPAEAHACRIPTPPAALRDAEADAVVLARITSVDGAGQDWRATARAWALLSGAMAEPDIRFSSESHSAVCGTMSAPKPGGLWILYLQRSDDGMRVRDAASYWWARRSGDPRLGRLDTLLPLGAVREPTPTEARMLDLAEPRVALPAGETDLSRYTRIYARSSAGTLRALLLRAGPPRRLMVDYSEEFPTEASCRCTLVHQFVDLDDLWRAGRLPPFNP